MEPINIDERRTQKHFNTLTGAIPTVFQAIREAFHGIDTENFIAFGLTHENNPIFMAADETEEENIAITLLSKIFFCQPEFLSTCLYAILVTLQSIDYEPKEVVDLLMPEDGITDEHHAEKLKAFGEEVRQRISVKLNICSREILL